MSASLKCADSGCSYFGQPAPRSCGCCAELKAAAESNEWEVLAVGYQALSGKAYHMSDCATCCAPAYKPSPCDCAAPAGQTDVMRDALQRIADYENDMLNGHEKFEAVQDIAREALP